MKVAAYQAPLEACYSNDAVALIGEQVRRCEAEDVELLCCPEGSLGGLADYVDDPRTIAIDATGGGGGGGGQLARVLAPLASDTVTTIVGFTEVGASAHLYNSAAVLHRGDVVSVYRKLHPAMRRSVYHAGSEMPVFTVGGLTFGIVICY